MTTPRCLVVEDDPELLQSVCDDLRRFGLDVAAASAGAEIQARIAPGSAHRRFRREAA